MTDETQPLEIRFECIHCESKIEITEPAPRRCPCCERNLIVRPNIFYAALNGAYLFNEQCSETFAAIDVNGHREIWPAKSSQFRNYLGSRLRKLFPGVMLSRDRINSLITAAESFAFEGKNTHSLYVRVARHENAIWIDLCDNQWRAVKITKQGWHIVDQPPILFRRYSHMQPMAVAESGTTEDFDAFINVLNAKQEDKLLHKVRLAANFIPGIPQPIFLSWGAQGGAKTTTMGALRNVVDPSVVPVLALPKDDDQLKQQLAHNYVTYYDNVHLLSQQQSDTLCRACTGEGVSKRVLFTDDDDFIYRYKRVVGVNGLSVPGTSPDFLDRAIGLLFNRIPKTERKRLTEIEAQFDRLMPKVRAYLFTVVSEALNLESTIPMKNLPRMADFAHYGEACSQAMGYPKGAFLAAYENNISEQNKTAVENSLIGDLVVQFAQSKETPVIFEGTPTKLYEELQDFAASKGIHLGKDWPKAPQGLTRRLRPFVPPLEELGYCLNLDGHDSKGYRSIKLEKIASKASEASNLEVKKLDAILPLDANSVKNEPKPFVVDENSVKNTIASVIASTDSPSRTDAIDASDGISLNSKGQPSQKEFNRVHFVKPLAELGGGIGPFSVGDEAELEHGLVVKLLKDGYCEEVV